MFNQSSYTFQIPDISETFVGMKVGQVFATDLDTGSDGKISFYLQTESYYFSMCFECDIDDLSL